MIIIYYKKGVEKMGIEETVMEMEFFISRKLSGEELLIVALAYQNGIIQGLKEYEKIQEFKNR
jgi:hypothetical protein